MKTIYKFTLRISDEQILEIPNDGEILSVQMQNGEPQIWVMVESDDYITQRHFRIFGTGHEVSGNLKFIGTVHIETFVWHLFEELKS